jgi:hypothetical protein
MRALALTLKILAIIFWLGSAWVFMPMEISDLRATSKPMQRDTPPDWGTPTYRVRAYISIGETIALLCLSVIPNRLFVRSWWSFLAAFVVAYFPAGFVIFNSLGGGTMVFAVIISLVFYAPLPLSLAASFWSCQKGEKISYA